MSRSLPRADRKDEPRQLPAASVPEATVPPLPESTPVVPPPEPPPEFEPEVEPDIAPLLEAPCPPSSCATWDASAPEPLSLPPLLHATTRDATVRERNAAREACRRAPDWPGWVRVVTIWDCPSIRPPASEGAHRLNLVEVPPRRGGPDGGAEIAVIPPLLQVRARTPSASTRAVALLPLAVWQ